MSAPHQAFPCKATWPIAIGDLIARRDAQYRRLLIASFIGIPFMLILLLGPYPASTWFGRENNVWGVVATFALMFCTLSILIWNFRRTTLLFDLVCPHCRWHFADPRRMMHTIATGNCSRCGANLVADHPAAREGEDTPKLNDATPSSALPQWPMPLKELTVLKNTYTRKVYQRLGIFMLMFLACIFGWGMWHVRYHQSPGQLMSSLPAISMIALSWLIYLANRRTARKLGLTCPTCHESLGDKELRLLPLAIATGNCGRCGHQLVSGHPTRHPSFDTPNTAS